MLCNSCKNKHICKYYEYFNNATIHLVVQVNECELFSGNQQPIVNPAYKAPAASFRQPLPSRPVDEEEEEEIDIAELEKVYININNMDKEPQSASIVDLLMKGDNSNEKEN